VKRAGWRTIGGLLLVAAASAGCTSAGADDAVVQMTGQLRFEPTTIEIPVGGTVTWHNDGTYTHTATSIEEDRSPSGEFDSGEVVGTGSFAHTFTEAGEYLYQCQLHGMQEMIGLVVVGS
jgi:plastocyanin